MTTPDAIPGYRQSIIDHKGTLDDVHYLLSHLGDAFVKWVLADEEDSFTDAQLEVAGILAGILRFRTSAQPELPIAFAASGLSFYAEPVGATFLNHCRKSAGGEQERAAGADSKDKLLSALVAFAEECYGEMLLPTHMGMHGPRFHYHVKTEVGRNLVSAIRDAQIFPVWPEMDYSNVSEQSIEFMRSFPAGMHAENLIWAAWNHAKLTAGIPTLDQLAAALPIVLDQQRRLASGKTAMITAVASLTGVRIPDDAQISGTWGKIRPARPEDHPASVRSMAEKRTTTTTDDGDHIEITDAGDIIFETKIPIQMRANDDGGCSFPASEDFEEKINKIRLAFALAVERPSRPIIFATWQATFIPLAFLEPLPLADPQFMASRMPTRLTPEELASWQHWINVIMAADMSHLKLAMTRTLRALAERRDSGDRLIDAVIAWESLFGGRPETTLRVSASLARLLHPPVVQKREAARKTYQIIYDARSTIVHAGDKKISAAQIDKYGLEAINTSLKAMAKLLTTHTSLLSLGADSRSKQILLGADYLPDSADTTPDEASS